MVKVVVHEPVRNVDVGVAVHAQGALLVVELDDEGAAEELVFAGGTAAAAAAAAAAAGCMSAACCLRDACCVGSCWVSANVAG